MELFKDFFIYPEKSYTNFNVPSQFKKLNSEKISMLRSVGCTDLEAVILYHYRNFISSNFELSSHIYEKYGDDFLHPRLTYTSYKKYVETILSFPQVKKLIQVSLNYDLVKLNQFLVENNSDVTLLYPEVLCQ
jgi:hypothetical protein